MKTLRVLFVVLFAFSSNAFAQEGPIVVAQAGGASQGAGAPAATAETGTGIGKTLAAVVAAIVAAAIAGKAASH